jgi:excisionase family DNA binding protein
MTVGEAAEHIRVHPQTIRRWIKEGRLEALDFGVGRNHVYRVRVDDLASIGRLEAPTGRPRRRSKTGLDLPLDFALR